MIFNFGGEEHKRESKGEKSHLRWRTKEKTRLEVLAMWAMCVYAGSEEQGLAQLIYAF